MIRYFLVLALLFTALLGLSDAEILKRANSFMKTGTKSDQFRAYNDYKNLYLRAIMNNDDSLRRNSLNGIVKSGKKLHIDVEQYENELTSLKPSKTYNKPKSKPNKVSKKVKELKVKPSNKLKNISWYNDKLILKFDKNLKKSQINYFKLYDSKSKRYRYIFDIHASMLSKSQNLRKEGIKRIKIAQFKPNTLRLVIENDTKIKVKFNRNKSRLTISMLDGKFKKEKKVIAKKITTASKHYKNKIIVIDAGHGGKDPGAVGYRKYREKIITLKISKYLKDILKSRGYKVYMTRDNDKFIKLSKRTAYANKRSADLFISIHANAVPKKSASKAQGIECYFLSPSRSKRAEGVAAKENSADLSEMNFYGKQSFLKFLNHAKTIASHKLAIDLQRGMLGSLNPYYKDVHDGGVREGPFWVLVGAQMPAVLVEVGFISNPKEAKRLVNNDYRKKMAMGMADGIERYFQNN